MTAGSSADSAAGTVPPASLKTSSAERMYTCGDRISRASCRRFVFPCDSEDKSSPGNAAAPHCVGFPTWQDGSALCWVPNTMPNAGGVATNQASADKCAAAAFPATRSCPGWGAPARKQDRNKPSECERGWCGPPSFISRCDAVRADGI